MKNSFSVLLILTTAVFLASCTGGDSPKATADKFLTAYNDREFDEARKYATPETYKLVDLMENLSSLAQPGDSIKAGPVEILEERIEGDVAYVTFVEESSGEKQELKLKKIDGKWKVHITKEDIAAKDMLGGMDEEEGFWSDEDSVEFEVGEPLLE